MFANMTFADWCGVWIALSMAWCIWEFFDTVRRLSALVKGEPVVEHVSAGEEEETLDSGKEVRHMFEKVMVRSHAVAAMLMILTSMMMGIGKGAVWPYFLYRMIIADKTVIHNEK